MMRALVLDFRVVPRQLAYAGVVLLGFVAAGIFGSLMHMWVFAAMWISATASHTHRVIETGGAFGVLQTTLGISRAQSVTARYLAVTSVVGACLAGSGVVALIWRAQGRDLTTWWGLLAVIAMATLIGVITLTLGYVASPTVQQWATIPLVIVVAGAGMAVLFQQDGDTSVRALVDALYAGPVPLVAVFSLAAGLTCAVGCSVAVRRYARCDLSR